MNFVADFGSDTVQEALLNHYFALAKHERRPVESNVDIILLDLVDNHQSDCQVVLNTRMDDRSVWDVPARNMTLERRRVFENFVKVRDTKHRNLVQ